VLLEMSWAEYEVTRECPGGGGGGGGGGRRTGASGSLTNWIPMNHDRVC